MLNIIIPYYNDKENLRKALFSLCAQTNKKFITTIVDDNSDEDIKDLIEEFKELTIIYIRNEENLGPGLSRQKGIDLAYKRNFEYIIFLDSDDILYPRAIDLLSHEARINNADVVYTPIQVEEAAGGSHLIQLDNCTTWTHGKIYKTSFLKDNNISFHEKIKYNEDSYFNLLISLLAKRKFKVNEPVYLWRNNKNSLTRKNREDFIKISNKDYIYGQCEVIQQLLYRNQITEDKYESIVLTIINIYYKWQLQELFYKNTNFFYSEEFTTLFLKIINILKNKKILEILRNKKILKYIVRNCHVGEEVNGKIYFYPENFLEWINSFGVKELISYEHLYN